MAIPASYLGVLGFLVLTLSGCVSQPAPVVEHLPDVRDLVPMSKFSFENGTVRFWGEGGLLKGRSELANQIALTFHTVESTELQTVEIAFKTNEKGFGGRPAVFWQLWSQPAGEVASHGGGFLYTRMGGATVMRGGYSFDVHPYRDVARVTGGPEEGQSEAVIRLIGPILLTPGDWVLAVGMPTAVDADVTIKTVPELMLAGPPYLGPGCRTAWPEDFESDVAAGVMWTVGAMMGGSLEWTVERSLFGYLEKGNQAAHRFRFELPDGSSEEHDSLLDPAADGSDRWILFPDRPGLYRLEVDHSVSLASGEFVFHFCMGPY